MHLDKLYRKYVHLGEKSNNELKIFLLTKGVASQTSLFDSNLGFLSCFACNLISTKMNMSSKEQDLFVKGFIKNPSKFIQMYNFEFELFSFKHSPENNSFYENYESRECADDIVYVIFENNSNSFDCNSNRLLLELLVFKGINEDDVNNLTNSYYTYLTYIKFLHEKEY